MLSEVAMRGLFGICLMVGWVGVAAAADSLCASVKIEIWQELTLERQAFEANMKISNGLTGISLTDVAVVLSFEDADRRPVTFTVGDAYATVLTTR